MAISPLFTVAIPTYNGSHHLRETLRSVSRQEGIDLAFLLSDDRSEDDTVSIAREEFGDRVEVIINSERLGLAGNWNQCMRLSHTSYTGIIHQDDILEKNHLAKHQRAFLDDPSIGLAASASTVIDHLGRPVPETIVGRGGLGLNDRKFRPQEALPLMAVGNPLRCSAVSLKNSAFETTGGFNPSLRYVVDWDLWIKLAQTTSIAWFAEPTVRVRWHVESETHRFANGTVDLEETEMVLERLLGDLQILPLERDRLTEQCRQNLALAYLNRAYAASKNRNAQLARTALKKALSLDRRNVLRRLVRDPRLTGRLLLTSFSGR